MKVKTIQLAARALRTRWVPSTAAIRTYPTYDAGSAECHNAHR